jgi:phytoene dehydrogenase-like protein
MPDYDAIVIGAGHNGLTAGTTLAKQGLKVLCLERTGWVGGMAATKELFKGYKHSVGAWAALILHPQMHDVLELEKYGVEFIIPRTSFCSFGEPGDTPFIAWNDQEKMVEHLVNDHGPDVLEAFTHLFEYVMTFSQVMDAERFKAPSSPEELIANAPDERSREILKECFYGKSIDIIRRFFPDPNRCRTIQGSLTAMTIDGTHLGPFSAGTGPSMVYHYTAGGVANLFKMIKGGIGNMSNAMLRAFEANGGEVQYRSHVERFLIEDGRVVGVELRGGERITGGIVMSTADARTTFIDMVGEDHLPDDVVRNVRKIEYKNGYIQIHLTLSETPEFEGYLAFANENNIRWLVAYTPAPERIAECWEHYQRGEVPESPLSYCYIPSLVDPTLAPPGCHTATFFAHYFPYDISEERHSELKEVMADRVVRQVAQYSPNFEKSITNRAILTNRYFEGKFNITGGDFSHGLLHPNQMWNNRPVPGWSDYRTPIAGLYMCGSACHPGPGVTGIPGYNGANAALKDIAAF